MGRTNSKNEGQQVDQTLLSVATKEREEIKRTTKQKTMEDIDGGLHPVVDAQSLGKRRNVPRQCPLTASIEEELYAIIDRFTSHDFELLSQTLRLLQITI